MSTGHDLDLAIVGAGPAGLRIAQQLRASGARLRVFEELSGIGGRTATQVVDGVHVNTGAMFVYRGTNTDKLCAELGIGYEPVEPRTFGIHINGKTVLGTRSDQLADALPISVEAKDDMRRLVDSLSLAYAEHGADLTGADHLSTVSLSEFIGPIGDEARSIIWSAVAGACVGTPDELSANSACGTWRASWSATAPIAATCPTGCSRSSGGCTTRCRIWSHWTPRSRRSRPARADHGRCDTRTGA